MSSRLLTTYCGSLRGEERRLQSTRACKGQASASLGQQGAKPAPKGTVTPRPAVLTSPKGHSSSSGYPGGSSRVGSGGCGTGPKGPSCFEEEQELSSP